MKYKKPKNSSAEKPKPRKTAPRDPANKTHLPWLRIPKRGPMPAVVTPTEMRLLGQRLLTIDEAAATLGIGRSTLHTRMRDVPELRDAWEAGHDDTLAALRQRQIEIALSPDHPQATAMLLHLGKTLLGQKEISRQEHTGADGGPIIKYSEVRRTLVKPGNGHAELAPDDPLFSRAPNGHAEAAVGDSGPEESDTDV